MSEQNMQPTIQEVVKAKYGAAAREAAAGGMASCSGGSEPSCCHPITRDLYDSSQCRTAGKSGGGFAGMRESDDLGAIATG